LPKKDKDQSGSRRRAVNKPVCANCVVCKQDTELCPLNENYSPDAYLKWEEEYLKKRKENGLR